MSDNIIMHEYEAVHSRSQCADCQNFCDNRECKEYGKAPLEYLVNRQQCPKRVEKMM